MSGQYLGNGKVLVNGHSVSLTKPELILLLDEKQSKIEQLENQLHISQTVDDMPSFKGFNSSSGKVCPVCKTNKNCETVLVPITETKCDGIVECMQVHKKCYKLFMEMNSEI